MKHAGRWLLWSPARFMRVTACMVVVLIVWGVTGAVLFGRDTDPAAKTETASSAVEWCRRGRPLGSPRDPVMISGLTACRK